MYIWFFKVVVSYIGFMKKFNLVVEIVYGKEIMKYIIEFDLINDIFVKFFIVILFGIVKSIFSFVLYVGGWSNFKCYVDVFINGKVVEGDVVYNSWDLIEGFIVIKIFFENYWESEFFFRYNGGFFNFNSCVEYFLEG